jgi:Fe2+ transport system protein FeoA
LNTAEEERCAELGIVLVLDSRQGDFSARQVRSLIARIKSRTGCHIVETSYSERGDPAISQAVGRAVERGADQVVVIPALISPRIYDDGSAIRRAVEQARSAHPGVKVVYSGPLLDEVGYENLIVSAIHEHEMMAQEPRLVRLNELPPGRAGIVHSLEGGRHFVSRMVSLGFTPGTEVKVVQNYGSGVFPSPDRDFRTPFVEWSPAGPHRHGCLLRFWPISRGRFWKPWLHPGERHYPGYGHGSIIANVRNARVALGWREARRVLVILKGDEERNSDK